MLRFLKTLIWLGVLILLGLAAYGWTGYRDARAATPVLSARADELIAAGRGAADLGFDRKEILLAVEDPAFYSHVGFDLTTPGGGITTITQSLSKRVGFDDFQPGIAKLRQTGYAIGLERGLTKPQILALFLDTVEMGRGPDGAWITGLWSASAAHFDGPPADVTREEFIKMVAVMIAPSSLALGEADAELVERAARIERLLAGACVPDGNGDVWLSACAESQ